jgi:hypothetical protein
MTKDKFGTVEIKAIELQPIFRMVQIINNLMADERIDISIRQEYADQVDKILWKVK